jgi:hypothetical protein
MLMLIGSGGRSIFFCRRLETDQSGFDIDRDKLGWVKQREKSCRLLRRGRLSLGRLHILHLILLLCVTTTIAIFGLHV